MKTILFYFLIPFCSAAKLPSNFKKCNKNAKDFEECLPKAVEDAMRQLTKPMKEVGLPNLKPLEVPALDIGAGTRAVGLQQHFRNLKLYGFTDTTCTKMDVDFEKKTVHNECFYPEIRMEAQYNSSGNVLLLEVYGNGDAVILLEKVRIPVDYKVEEYQKNGKTYWKIVDTKLTLYPENVHFQFDNLFNGDKLLGDNINKVINDNSKEIFDDVKSGYEQAFEEITESVFNSILSRVPISEFFTE